MSFTVNKDGFIWCEKCSKHHVLRAFKECQKEAHIINTVKPARKKTRLNSSEESYENKDQTQTLPFESLDLGEAIQHEISQHDNGLFDLGTDPDSKMSEKAVNIAKLAYLYAMNNNLSEKAIEGLFDLLSIGTPELKGLSIYMIQKMVGKNQTSFKKFAQCPRCGELYTEEDFITKKVCTFKPFSRGSVRCNTFMAKEIIKNNQTVYVPMKIAAISSIKSQLLRMFLRPGFEDSIESWRQRDLLNNVLADIFDGRVWRESQVLLNKAFLSLPYNLVLQLNYDDFQPFEKRVYGCGAVYVINLSL